MSAFDDARRRERNYHIAYYARHSIGDEGTWLVGPSPYVIDSFRYLSPFAAKGLDIGAGVGRHTFPLIEKLGRNSEVVCIDLLDSALQKLADDAKRQDLNKHVITLSGDIAEYEPNITFDYVLSVSVLEHLPDEAALRTCLERLQKATNLYGVHCFMIATEHVWSDQKSGKAIEPIVEQNLSAATTKALLKQLYNSWDIKDISEKDWEQIESVDGKNVICASTCIQFTAIKSKED